MINARKSIRVPGHDYTQSRAYFTTICANQHACLFGDIVDGQMKLNRYGKIVRDEWLKTEDIRPNVLLDEYVIMPNHVHGIMIVDGYVGARRAVPLHEQFGQPVPGGIPTIIRAFKSAVTKRIRQISNMPNRTVWQRNYYEHIIRSDELNTIRQYIINNPVQWDHDVENTVHDRISRL